MFYVKEKMSDVAEMTIEITDENVYCTCPKCGVEVSVDLAEVLKDGDSDLFSTAVCCADCSRKIRKGELNA